MIFFRFRFRPHHHAGRTRLQGRLGCLVVARGNLRIFRLQGATASAGAIECVFGFPSGMTGGVVELVVMTAATPDRDSGHPPRAASSPADRQVSLSGVCNHQLNDASHHQQKPHSGTG